MDECGLDNSSCSVNSALCFCGLMSSYFSAKSHLFSPSATEHQREFVWWYDRADLESLRIVSYTSDQHNCLYSKRINKHSELSIFIWKFHCNSVSNGKQVLRRGTYLLFQRIWKEHIKMRNDYLKEKKELNNHRTWLQNWKLWSKIPKEPFLNIRI